MMFDDAQGESWSRRNGKKLRRDEGRINGTRPAASRIATVLASLAQMRALPPAAGLNGTGRAGTGQGSEAPPGLRQSMDPVDPRHLVELWRNWAMVMGPDLAQLALPLGRRNDILIVGGEDNLSLQELSFQTPELLERANAFMDASPEAPVFRRVDLRLTMGQRPLHLPPDVQASVRIRPAPPRPERLGEHLADMRPDSPVARCYAAYLRMHGAL